MNPINITDAAIAHLKNMVNKNEKGIGFRLSLKKTGCSGLAYVPEVIEVLNEKDIHFNQAGLNVYIAIEALDFIKNLTIDYASDEVNSLKQKRLLFINPNEKNRCGCGESFTM